jgi:3-hydroxyisobutyrate dehydrogenase-like beta-hydroxyacid dehydrogenase
MASGDAESLTKARPVLDALGKEVHIIEGGAGFGSTVKCVHQLLAGVHICAAAEAMAMAAKAGLDVEQLYRIVNGAAGASWMFTDRGQRMLSAEADVKSALDIFVKDLDIVYSESKTMQCPIPLASVALQQFISGQCLGLGKSDDSQVVKVYERITGVSIASKVEIKKAESMDTQDVVAPTTGQNVVVVGIGAMGGGMACALLAASITRCVTGYDKSVDAVKTFFGESQAAKKAPLSIPSSMTSAITESTDFVVLSLVNQGQCEQVCFGEGDNLLNLVPKGSCVVMTSTVTGTSTMQLLALKGCQNYDYKLKSDFFFAPL